MWASRGGDLAHKGWLNRFTYKSQGQGGEKVSLRRGQRVDAMNSVQKSTNRKFGKERYQNLTGE